MFSRLQFQETAFMIGMIAFAITAAIYFYFLVKALRMKPDEAESMANRPLESDHPETDKHL